MTGFYISSKLIYISCFMIGIINYKYNIKKSYSIIILFNIILWAINFTIYRFAGEQFLHNISLLVYVIPEFICFSLVSKSKGFKLLFSFLLVVNFSLFRNYIGQLAKLLTNNMFVVAIAELITFIIIFIVIITIFRKRYFELQDSLNNGWGIMCIVPCLLYVLLYSLCFISQPFKYDIEVVLITLFVFILMFVIYIVSYLIFQNISGYYHLKHEKDMIIALTDLYKTEYDAIMNNINQTKIYRHDMRHHNNIIRTFIKNNDIENAKAYLENVNEILDDIVLLQYCENYYINAILSNYISKAKSENIDIKFEVSLSQDYDKANIDLGLIFMNALENAIHACEEIENPDNRKICIFSKENQNQIHVQITNTYQGEVIFKGEFPVSKYKDHGFGTKSIAMITEKSGGMFSFIAQNNIFQTNVILTKNNMRG